MTPDTGDFSLLRVIVAFGVVFGLLGALGYGMKYLTARGIKLPGPSGRPRRMEIVESLAIDVRRRLVIVRCDNREHLLLLGANQDVVVATDVTLGQKQP